MSGEGDWGALASDIVTRLQGVPALALQIERTSHEDISDEAAKRFPSIFVRFGGWTKDVRSRLYVGSLSPEGPAAFDIIMYQSTGREDDGLGSLGQLMTNVRTRLMGWTPPSQVNSAYFFEIESESEIERFVRKAGTGLFKMRATYSIRQTITRPVV